jgi:uncharacterized protein (DUF488 family)
MLKNNTIKLFTIGFTRKSAEVFFEKLRTAGITRLIDTRLNNTSQLSGFAKQADLQYFLRQITRIDYEHQLPLAPNKDILDAYKQKKISWQDYEKCYLELLKKRAVESIFGSDKLANACLLCSEDKPHYCHRCLAAEYLRQKLENIEIFHL